MGLIKALADILEEGKNCKDDEGKPYEAAAFLIRTSAKLRGEKLDYDMEISSYCRRYNLKKQKLGKTIQYNKKFGWFGEEYK